MGILSKWFSLEYVLSVVRALLMGAGGGLVASGALDPEQLNTLVGGVLVLVSMVWSYLVHSPGNIAAQKVVAVKEVEAGIINPNTGTPVANPPIPATGPPTPLVIK